MGPFLNKLINTVTLLSFVLLSGCGGGGSSSSETIPIITPPPPPPTNTVPDCTPTTYTNTLYCTSKRQNLNREFYIYIPDDIDTTNSQVPLLFSLHGYTSRAIWNLGYTGFQSIAETEKFIVIYPQGTILASTGETHWNVGGWTVGSTTDDIDYLSSLIDWAYSEYKIDRNRVYSTGMSNGGFMSYHLACNLSYKIAAVASVTGSMTPQTYNSCSPTHPTAILQIHGTADGVVPYYGNSISRAIPTVMDYWEEYNDCEQEIINIIDDVNGDGDGGYLYSYNQCLSDVNLRLYLMTNMGHEWPTNNGQNDIIAANEIWYFLKQYDVNGKINF
tara:strand:- start:1051 stop:2043 length:993 start_codon:yes stop_codon:yes gene_type:complete